MTGGGRKIFQEGMFLPPSEGATFRARTLLGQHSAHVPDENMRATAANLGLTVFGWHCHGKLAASGGAG